MSLYINIILTHVPHRYFIQSYFGNNFAQVFLLQADITFDFSNFSKSSEKVTSSHDVLPSRVYAKTIQLGYSRDAFPRRFPRPSSRSDRRTLDIPGAKG